MINIRQMLKNGPILLDGATGTNLQSLGMPMGVCPEQWMLEHKAIVLALERQYVEAGSHIIYAPTFTASRLKLAEYGLQDQVAAMNRKLVAVAKEAAAGKCLVAGNLTMTGQLLAPMGPLDFETLVDCYKEQARAIAAAGADLFVIETMMHIGEARAALLAVKEVCELPVMVTMTVEDSGKTMYGTDSVTALVTLQSMGADAVGLNCSTGPDRLLPYIREMKKYACVPLIVKPNAGLPTLVDGNTVFDMDKETFVHHMESLVAAGASIIGGCCGTTPEYIRLLAERVRGMEVFVPEKRSVRVLTGEHSVIGLDLSGNFTVIGERINPTGKKALQEALKAGDFDMVQEMALTQVEDGAGILDINVGMSGIDEKAVMLKVIDAVNEVVDVPLCIDSSSPEVVEAALRRYHGRALVNSVSCERVKLEKLLPIVKKYGAMFIMLPLTDKGLPENFEERVENLKCIMDAAFALGLSKEDMVADGLVATLGANPLAGIDTLQTIGYCHDTLRIATVCGLSNISFGLPDRGYVNSIFLALAISRGLTMAIANPCQELLMRSAFAADLVMNKPESNLRYIESAALYRERREKAAPSCESGGVPVLKAAAENSRNAAPDTENAPSLQTCPDLALRRIYEAVLKGKKKLISGYIKEALEEGFLAKAILDTALIPAINQVGEYFNAKKYFLPQLMLSAECMKKGVDDLEPMLLNDTKSNGCTIVIATVEGDIHDIGKNLVAMMMKNYGFQVIDLGKDVPAEKIVNAAQEYKADIIALSALMTTTMQRMRDVVDLVRARGLLVKIMIGGAVITEEYAREIGADGYSKDAVSAVELVHRLMEKP